MYLQKSRYWIVVFTFVFALLLGGRMFASVTASISGTVKDASGASIPGATVTATDTGTGIAKPAPPTLRASTPFRSFLWDRT